MHMSSNHMLLFLFISYVLLIPSSQAVRRKWPSPSLSHILQDYSSDGGRGSAEPSSSSSKEGLSPKKEESESRESVSEEIQIQDLISIPEGTLSKVVTQAYKKGAKFASTLFASVVDKARSGQELKKVPTSTLWEEHPEVTNPPDDLISLDQPNVSPTYTDNSYPNHQLQTYPGSFSQKLQVKKEKKIPRGHKGTSSWHSRVGSIVHKFSNPYI